MIEQLENLGRFLDTYVGDNHALIKGEIEGERLKMLKAVANHPDPFLREYFDLDRRGLSEMPLCATWHLFDQLKPLGAFEVKRCLVRTTNGGNLGISPRLGPEHYMVYNPKSNFVGCLFAGQYVRPVDRLGPGERIKLLKDWGGDLVRVFPDLALLRGNREKIRARLGLFYRFPGEPLE